MEEFNLIENIKNISTDTRIGGDIFIYWLVLLVQRMDLTGKAAQFELAGVFEEYAFHLYTRYKSNVTLIKRHHQEIEILDFDEFKQKMFDDYITNKKHK